MRATLKWYEIYQRLFCLLLFIPVETCTTGSQTIYLFCCTSLIPVAPTYIKLSIDLRCERMFTEANTTEKLYRLHVCPKNGSNNPLQVSKSGFFSNGKCRQGWGIHGTVLPSGNRLQNHQSIKIFFDIAFEGAIFHKTFKTD